ncbi:hypothetical protein IJ21_04280 [Paenibacillus sp. 32O-W]|uniref:DUF6597 domain-containing transcriptional factor n=1 Tax=Paenibacillus sp. 32O-W TaxID=1695218 RepID=UPI000721004C|nr:DUF6597 domain-containing transcriptional factor [Paenibacillus sp. 32O-W]ALS25860.1 hypothetical protein IJ21_04280 [Paenibacillus sp. 32O-W]
MQLKIHTLFQPIQANGRVPSNQYIEITPSPKLAPYVSCYWLSEPVTENQEPDSSSETLKALREGSVDRVLPDGCSDIIFEHDLKANKYRTLFSGIFDEPFTITYVQNHPVRKFGVRFFPGGNHSLLGIPQQDFAKSHFDIDLVWAGKLKRLKIGFSKSRCSKKKCRSWKNFWFLSCAPKL